MFQQGKTGEIHVADFSPSSSIGTSVIPIKQMLNILANAENSGDDTAVVTARKGKTDLDALGGGKVPATNAADIKDFVSQEAGVSPDVVYGAADFSPTDPASGKRDLIIKLASDEDVDNIHFYDDDPENAKRVAQLCDDAPELTGKELDIYNYEFAKGENPTKPTFQCTIGESKSRKLTERRIRRIVRKVLAEQGCMSELDLEEAESRSYKGKEYSASKGSISALKKHGWSLKKAVKAGDFDWADDPYAAAKAAYIVGKGKAE